MAAAVSVFPQCPAPVRRFYDRERAAQQRRQAALAQFASAPAVSADGERIEIGANISSTAEAVAAFANGADGVGLFRTELLFARRNAPPSEDEQFAIYSDVVRAAKGRPVILRTADIGGDKPLPYLKLPAESNPFLGYRGIRIYPEFREWISAQLRAALRAAAVGPVWLMAPMVASLEEALWFKSEVARAREDLRARGAAADAAMPLGAMIEVPSAAFQLPLMPGARFLQHRHQRSQPVFFCRRSGKPQAGRHRERAQPCVPRAAAAHLAGSAGARQVGWPMRRNGW